MQKITSSLWFDKNAEEAMNFYTSVFENSKINRIQNYPDNVDDEHMKGMSGKVLHGEFELAGQKFICLDGGPYFKFNPAVSFMISCATAEEVDALHNKLIEGGSTLMPLDKYPFSERYAWISDKFGLSWQISVSQSPQKITPSFMFVGDHFGQAEEAINFYTSLFKNSGIDMIAKYEPGEQDQEGKVKFASFHLEGQSFAAMESSFEHKFAPNESISQYVECEDQAEVDQYWNALIEGGPVEAQQCGWVKDKYGFSWQIIPKRLGELLTDPDKEKSGRVMKAMLQMKKIDVAKLEEAANAA